MSTRGGGLGLICVALVLSVAGQATAHALREGPSPGVRGPALPGAATVRPPVRPPVPPARVLVDEGFEADPVAAGTAVFGGPAGWLGWSVLARPAAGRYTVAAPHGAQALRLVGVRGARAGTTTTHRVRPGLRYRLSAVLGDGGARPFGVRLAVTACGRTVAALDVTTPPVPHGVGPAALTWTATQAAAGCPVGLELGNDVAGTGRAALADVDAVRLTVAGTADAPRNLVVASPRASEVLQRGPDGTAAVPVRTTVPAGTAVRVRLVPRVEAGVPVRGAATAWVAVRGSGYGTASLPAVAAGWYDLQVQARRAGRVVTTATVPGVGVGEVFLTFGQSNSANSGSVAQHVDDPRASAPLLGLAGWRVADDPQPNATNVNGSPWPAFLDAVVAAEQVPAAVVAIGFGSTGVGDWSPDGLLHHRVDTALAALGPHGVRAVLWHQGEHDSIRCTPAATYAADLEATVTGLRAATGRPDLPFFVATASAMKGSTPGCRASVRAAQAQVRADLPGVLEGPDTDGYAAAGWSVDGIHFDPRGLRAHGTAWAARVLGSGVVPR